MTTLQSELDKENILHLLSNEGPLAEQLKGFESRTEQQEMMGNIIDAFNNRGIALIEAGTGTGKSIAYLIPAILWAAQKGEATVISTNTINLQEQLISKDIPLLLKALGIKVKAVLVKGMSNYLCIRKLHDAQDEKLLLPPDEAAELEQIEKWGQRTNDGSRSDLPFVPTPQTWERVSAESDTCNHKKCPFFEPCHFMKARRRAYNAKILVVNHSLLFADLSAREQAENFDDTVILPPYQKVILDESHNVEDVATKFFGVNLSRIGFQRIIGGLANEKQGKFGKLVLLRQKLMQHLKNPTPDQNSLQRRLDIDLPQMYQSVRNQLGQAFDHFVELLERLTGNLNGIESETKLRLRPEHHTHPMWGEAVAPQAQQAIADCKAYATAVFNLVKDVEGSIDDTFIEKNQGLFLEIRALAERLSTAANAFEKFVDEKIDPTQVYWIEARPFHMMTNVRLAIANLDLADQLAKTLFARFPTTILCSATLSTNQRFDFIKERLGITPDRLEEKPVSEHIYDSPFNYEKQALLAIPSDIPNPSEPQFLERATELIWQAIQASRGNAFVLFTSYSMLKNCANTLTPRFEQNGYTLFRQGEENRQALLNRFKATDRAVLFGTDSFWEGVDVAGEDLRCVVIVKLPFQVPTEPIFQARNESILAAGGSPFMDYAVPQAIVKFKQGFGRLIRHKKDRGCIVCLDNRLVKKGYGRLFLNSLPKCEQLFVPSGELYEKLDAFYRKTYPLTKS